MAQMLPRRLRLETKSAAERRLYEAFRDDLPNEHVVFHSVRWLARDPRSGAEDGEADFIIAHPDLGILVLEVKGGAIRYDGGMAQWFSKDNPVKDPVDQARRSKYSLLDKLKGLPTWRDCWITLGHAVAFPDVAVDRDLLPDLPEALVLDAPALANLEGWVRRALDYWHTHDQQVGGVGREGMETLCNILSPSWELRPFLCFALEEEKQEIIRLTEEQFALLDFLRGQRRAAGPRYQAVVRQSHQVPCEARPGESEPARVSRRHARARKRYAARAGRRHARYPDSCHFGQ